jgi:hypothetical protein
VITENPQGLYYPNVRAAFQYLASQGWKLSERTLYLHRDSGKLKASSNGQFSAQSLDRYARRYLRRVGAFSEVSQEEETPKQDAETRLRVAQAETWELKHRILAGQYVPQGEFEKALAARATILVSDADNWRHATAASIIDLVRGDPVLLPDLLEFLRTAHEAWFARYTEDREFTAPAPLSARGIEEITAEGGQNLD